ncbi:hypothetical protein COEREDRAFT_86816 [Coemansia reversa NRRL 1564]|uniref:Uncharacterized protein n=1 Tax=Coemansia reversa (strain ATCC 12441 / NRRL 1564) TaxID=763665 RepID=A0A2G5BCK0_COERN|nr:hypothetical protein COEREDRAFT_86816 [Coemansia reversa NRRL 1564]|eukprot:PIA16736.1 hypothetical protein COEREDRAFT_86816 [Coemansia reversa NRRL 1564]
MPSNREYDFEVHPTLTLDDFSMDNYFSWSTENEITENANNPADTENDDNCDVIFLALGKLGLEPANITCKIQDTLTEQDIYEAIEKYVDADVDLSLYFVSGSNFRYLRELQRCRQELGGVLEEVEGVRCAFIEARFSGN